MMLAKAKLASSITFIVLASFTIVTYDPQNMFIIQATDLSSWTLNVLPVHLSKPLAILQSSRELLSYHRK
jgi:hypothetical protein